MIVYVIMLSFMLSCYHLCYHFVIIYVIMMVFIPMFSVNSRTELEENGSEFIKSKVASNGRAV